MECITIGLAEEIGQQQLAWAAEKFALRTIMRGGDWKFADALGTQGFRQGQRPPVTVVPGIRGGIATMLHSQILDGVIDVQGKRAYGSTGLYKVAALNDALDVYGLDTGRTARQRGNGLIGIERRLARFVELCEEANIIRSADQHHRMGGSELMLDRVALYTRGCEEHRQPAI